MHARLTSTLRSPMQEAGESEAAAMVRILGLSREEVLRTTANVDAARERLYEQNDAVIGSMLRALPSLSLGEATPDEAGGTTSDSTD